MKRTSYLSQRGRQGEELIPRLMTFVGIFPCYVVVTTYLHMHLVHLGGASPEKRRRG